MAQSIADQLRRAIRECGLSANELAKAAGVPQTTVSRFLRGKDLGIERAGKLAAYLGLKLTK